MKDRKVKQFLSGGRCQWEGGEHKERVKRIWRMNLVLMYENGIMKLVASVLRKGKGVNLTCIVSTYANVTI
jgi:hypothetical protein